MANRHDIETEIKIGPFSLQVEADRRGWVHFSVFAATRNGTRSLMVLGHKCQHPPDEADDPNGTKLPEVDDEGFLSAYWHRYPWYWSMNGKVR